MAREIEIARVGGQRELRKEKIRVDWRIRFCREQGQSNGRGKSPRHSILLYCF